MMEELESVIVVKQHPLSNNRPKKYKLDHTSSSSSSLSSASSSPSLSSSSDDDYKNRRTSGNSTKPRKLNVVDVAVLFTARSFAYSVITFALVIFLIHFFVVSNPNPITTLNSYFFSCPDCQGPLQPDVAARDVDVVISWVDGSDPEWFAKKASFDDPSLLKDAIAARRFRNNNEVCYVLRSIRMHAPWVRHVWIVSDNQVPRCLDTSLSDWITLVDHTEIIPALYLPTYNSHVIEANLHRIKGLSEYFIYLNDDMFFSEEIQKSALFAPDGKLRICVEGIKSAFRIIPHTGSYTHGLSAIRTALSFYEKFPSQFPHMQHHQGLVMSRTLLEETWELFSTDMGITTSNRFRSKTDVIPLTMAVNLGFAMDEAVTDYCEDSLLIKLTGSSSDHDKLEQVLELTRRPRFLCVNDDSDSEDVQFRNEYLVDFLREMFPQPGSWEVPHWEAEWDLEWAENIAHEQMLLTDPTQPANSAPTASIRMVAGG